jgi:hypothetical protein
MINFMSLFNYNLYNLMQITFITIQPFLNMHHTLKKDSAITTDNDRDLQQSTN